ncbi:MAG TPA: response regulator [Rhizomicrobium sp.]|jgi:FixJ family two-component response regulator
MNGLMESVSPQVFVIDDDPSILVALKRLLNSAGYEARTFTSPREFLACHDADVPGCAVVDVGMDELSGIALQERLSLGDNPRPIVFVTACDDVRVSVQAMKAGAIDFLSKPVSDVALLSAVRSALELDHKGREERRELAELRHRYGMLTLREREVMAQILRGRLNKQIAYDLGIVEKTAKVHRGRVMEKMEVRSVAALTHIAERLGLYAS